MPESKFKNVPGKWHGNDYPSVSMTSVAVGSEKPLAFVFTTHMNVDFDRAPNCYGPDEKPALDSLANAGRFSGNGYYGLMAVTKTESDPDDKKKRPLKNGTRRTDGLTNSALCADRWLLN